MEENGVIPTWLVNECDVYGVMYPKSARVKYTEIEEEEEDEKEEISVTEPTNNASMIKFQLYITKEQKEFLKGLAQDGMSAGFLIRKLLSAHIEGHTMK